MPFSSTFNSLSTSANAALTFGLSDTGDGLGEAANLRYDEWAGRLSALRGADGLRVLPGQN